MAAQTLIKQTEFEYQLDFPEAALLKVDDGQWVARGEILAAVDNATCHQVELTNIFSLDLGQKALDELMVKIGQKVKEGDVLASRTKGFSKRELLSPVEGEVTGYTEAGVLKIESGQHQEVMAPFEGKIKIEDKQKIKIVFPAQTIDGEWGVGQEFIGPLVYVQPNQEDVFCVEADVLGSVVVFSQPVTQAALFKMVSLGAGGVVLVGDADKIKASMINGKLRLGDSFSVLVITSDDHSKLDFLKDVGGRVGLLDPVKKQLVVAVTK